MSKQNLPEAKEAKHGERMIEVRIRFWTNDIAEDQAKGDVYPKHAWASGMVGMDRNDAHEIKPERPKPFHSLMDVCSVIEKVLIQHDIVLHPTEKMKKYVSLEEHK